MNVVLVGLFSSLFITGFFLDEALRFTWWIYNANHSAGVILILASVAAFSGVVLFAALHHLGLFVRSAAKLALLGAVSGPLIFGSLFYLEDIYSDKMLNVAATPQSFSELRGHCGKCIGRAILKYYYLEWTPTVQNSLKDFQMANNCRNSHFIALEKAKGLSCQAGEDEIQCRLKWMDGFAKNGFWNPSARKLFFKQVFHIWDNPNTTEGSAQVKVESLLNFLIKDHELEENAQPIWRQAGILEQFSDEFHYEKAREEVENLMITKVVLEEAAKIYRANDSASDLEALQKYKEIENEIKLFLKK